MDDRTLTEMPLDELWALLAAGDPPVVTNPVRPATVEQVSKLRCDFAAALEAGHVRVLRPN